MEQTVLFNPNNLIGVGIKTKSGSAFTIANGEVINIHDGLPYIPCYVEDFYTSVFKKDGTPRIDINLRLIQACDIVEFTGLDVDYLDEIYEFDTSDLKNGMTFNDYYGVDRWLERYNRVLSTRELLHNIGVNEPSNLPDFHIEDYFVQGDTEEDTVYIDDEDDDDGNAGENADDEKTVEFVAGLLEENAIVIVHAQDEHYDEFGAIVGWLDGKPIYELDVQNYMGNY